VSRPRATRRSRLTPRTRPQRRPDGSSAKKVALVTGAARGIGAATVKRLALDGFHVIAVDVVEDDPRLPYSLGTAGELFGLRSERVQPVAADACDAELLGEIVDDFEIRWGGLDVVVAAAGVIAGGVPAWELDPEQEQAVLDINLGGVLTAARVTVPALLKRPEPRDGRFIAVASAASTRGLPNLAAYCAAKAGVVGFIRALAVELGPRGITANAVSPGSTRTKILDESARLYDIDPEAFADQQPLKRLLEPEEVAAMIAWLASPQSRGATGGNFPVDGGLGL
jgi:SDR family mycofactocin-dependent oxidoreductase